MRIGLVTQAYYPVLGGVTEHVWHLGTELQRRGHDVTVITGGVPHRLLQPGAATDHDRGLRVRRHGFQIPLMSNGANVYITVGWKLGRMLQRIEAEERFDVLHIQSPLDPGLPIIASKAMRTPKVGTYHTARQEQLGQIDLTVKLLGPVMRDALGKIQRHIAVSPSAADFVHRYFPNVPMTIIPNGIDVERFHPASPRREKKSNDVITILYVGRMDPRKGAKYLFASLPYLETALGDHYRVVVVGTGWMQKYYDAYIPLQLRKRVKFAGFVSPADLPGYYRAADIYCSPATGGESFGIVLLEAMASGTPVITSDIAGYRDVLTNDREGLLVPARSSRHLAEAIITVAKDPARRKRMGEIGRHTALKYDWRAVTNRIEAVYKKTART